MSIRDLPQLSGADHAAALAVIQARLGPGRHGLFLDGRASLPSGPLRVRDLVAHGSAAIARILLPLQDATGQGVKLRRWDSFGAVQPGEPLRHFLQRLGEAPNVEPLIGQWPITTALEITKLLEVMNVASIELLFWSGDGYLPTPRQSDGDEIRYGTPADLRNLDDPVTSFRCTPSVLWSNDPDVVIATHTDCTSSYLSGPRSALDALRTSELEWVPVDSPDELADDWTLREPQEQS